MPRFPRPVAHPADRPEPEVVARAGGFERPTLVRLPGGPLEILLRRSPRARRIRLVVDHRRGVVVTVPLRRGERLDAGPDRTVERFLGEREAWIRRHLGRHAALADGAAGARDLVDGVELRFRGAPHRLRIVPAAERGGPRRASVTREGTDEGDELVLRLGTGDARSPAAILEAWFRARARTVIEAAIERHAGALGVAPSGVTIRDPRTRWGSASRRGALSFSWRLVLAPPDALETVVVHELAHLRVFGHGPAFWALVASRRPDHLEQRRWLRRHASELHATLG